MSKNLHTTESALGSVLYLMLDTVHEYYYNRPQLDHTWLGNTLRSIYWWLAELHKREAIRVTFAAIRRTRRKAQRGKW